MKVTAVMSHPVITVAPAAAVKEAASLLVQHAVSALPVVDADGALVGIVSEADLLPIETRPDPRSQAIPLAPTAGSTPHTVADVMTRSVFTVETHAAISQAARMMLEAGVKRLPVMDGRRLVGIISRRDLIKVIARRDKDLKGEVGRCLYEAGIALTRAAVEVENGVATIHLQNDGLDRRLAESAALAVPGILEVRFES